MQQGRVDDAGRESARNLALLKAAREGQTHRVNKLLADGADVDYTDKFGLTALHHAALDGSQDVVDVLLNAGADVNAEEELLGTPLTLAAAKARGDIAEILLASGASVHVPLHALGSIMHMACAGGDVSIIKALHQRKTPLDDIVRVRNEVLDAVLPTWFDVKECHHFKAGYWISKSQCELGEP